MAIIRSATQEDLPKLVAMGMGFLQSSVYARCLAPSVEGMEAGVKAVLDNGVVLVAVDGDRLLGGIVGIAAPLWCQPETLVAIELAWWMQPEHRNSAAGVRLLFAFEDWAKQQGLAMVVLSDLVPTDRTKQDITPMLDRLGYQMVERSHIKAI